MNEIDMFFRRIFRASWIQTPLFTTISSPPNFAAASAKYFFGVRFFGHIELEA